MKKTSIDLTGKKFGDWTVIDKVIGDKKNSAWNCICKCGKRGAVRTYSLTRSKQASRSCVICLNQSRHGKYSTPGTVVGNWTIISVDLSRKTKHNKYIYVTCKCKCGHLGSISKSSLAQGRSKSCHRCMNGINREEMVGRVFYKWTVTGTKEVGRKGGSKCIMYTCRCACGQEGILRRRQLLDLRSSQCKKCCDSKK